MSPSQEELREIFAGLAMLGLLSGQTNYHGDEQVEHRSLGTKLSYADSIAHDAVLHADALIRALNEPKG